MKKLYLDVKAKIYRATAITFIVQLFGALGAGFFFVIQNLFQKYHILGLVLLVAIPLPGTGAWTGALVAAILNMRLRRALPAIALGVVIAAVVVSFLTYGAAALLG